MSMTQVAFIKKVDIPSKNEIEKIINELGYDFEIQDDFEKFDEINEIECSINGYKTFFEIYIGEPNEITNNSKWIKTGSTDPDTAISFVWGGDYAAGASIGLISIALIDISKALIYYIDDEMKYSREMLIVDTPLFLKELVKERKSNVEIIKKNPFWDKIKNIFK